MAVTRAKKNLIIYDQASATQMSHLRQDFDKWCFKLNIAVSANAKNIDSFANQYKADPNWK